MSLIKPIDPARFEQAASFEDDDFLLLPGLNKPWRQMRSSLLTSYLKANNGIRFFRKYADWTGTLTTSYQTVSTKAITFTESGLLLVWYSARIDIGSDTDGDANTAQIRLKLGSTTITEPLTYRLQVAASAGTGGTSEHFGVASTSATTVNFTSEAKKSNASAGAAIYGGTAYMLFIPGLTIE